MGLDAPTRRAVDIITHGAFVEATGRLEAEVAELEQQDAGYTERVFRPSRLASRSPR